MTTSKHSRPFDDLRRALAAEPGSSRTVEAPRVIRGDLGRRARTGSPEIVYAAGKSPEEVVTAARVLGAASGRVLASRCDASAFAALTMLEAEGWVVEKDDRSRVAVVSRPDAPPPSPVGIMGVIAAGTSDLPVARETELVARELGCETRLVVDVGIAGLHRLIEPLEAMLDNGVDVIVVVAGMDGALPSVVAGLVAVPVIGVPTSTGYGFGGDGTGAMMAMLQSCVPGLTIVNIDNGVGAAMAAGRIARRSSAEGGQADD